MGKVVALEWGAFMAGEMKPKEGNRRLDIARKTAATIHLILFPRSAFAATADDHTWLELFNSAMNVADWLVVGVFIFAGATWMFGNRTKTFEYLIGGASGYLIIRHAVDIRDWLKTL